METTGSNKSDTLIRVYGRFLKLAAEVDESIREKVYNSFGVLGQSFNRFVDELISRERSAEVVELIEKLAPYWEHNLGYARLGRAAFKAGERDIAEPFILKLREGLEKYYRCEEMSMLAEIWHDRGEAKKAQELLVDCMRKIIIAIKESRSNSDRKKFAESFRHHRSTYLRLFPDGENELAELGIPTEPL